MVRLEAPIRCLFLWQVLHLVVYLRSSLPTSDSRRREPCPRRDPLSRHVVLASGAATPGAVGKWTSSSSTGGDGLSPATTGPPVENERKLLSEDALVKLLDLFEFDQTSDGAA